MFGGPLTTRQHVFEVFCGQCSPRPERGQTLHNDVYLLRYCMLVTKAMQHPTSLKFVCGYEHHTFDIFYFFSHITSLALQLCNCK